MPEFRGQKLFYREPGSAEKPTMVLLHGFPSSSHMFPDLIPQLANMFYVIAPDYLGFGYSDASSATEFTCTFNALNGGAEWICDTLIAQGSGLEKDVRRTNGTYESA